MISLSEECNKVWMGGIELRGEDLHDIDAYFIVDYSVDNGVYKVGNWSLTTKLNDKEGEEREVDLTPHVTESAFNKLFEYYIVNGN